jgi:LuxR family maltose regulon positive regulatory protein
MMVGSWVSHVIAPDERVERRNSRTLALSNKYLAQGQANKASQTLAQIDLADPQLDRITTKFAFISLLGETALLQGKLHLAAATYHALLDTLDEQPLEPYLCRFYYGLCDLYYAWNHLEKAKQYLQHCLEKIKQTNVPSTWTLAGYWGLARILQAEGQAEAADTALQQALVIAQAAGEAEAIQQTSAHLARLKLQQGKPEAAHLWARTCGLTLTDRCSYARQFEYLTLVRFHLAQGGWSPSDLAQAKTGLEQHHQAALVAGRGGDLIEIEIAQALLFQAQGDREHAWVALAQALCRAEREEYIRIFIDEGPPIAALLQHTATQGVTLIYTKKLLALFANPPLNHTTPTPISSPEHPRTALPEPLSDRELEVLRLVTAGNSNSDIANLLCISQTTVKKHLGNILGKLEAKNRTQAVAKARAYGLL